MDVLRSAKIRRRRELLVRLDLGAVRGRECVERRIFALDYSRCSDFRCCFRRRTSLISVEVTRRSKRERPCRGGETRTPDQRIWNPLLYQLSYTPTTRARSLRDGHVSALSVLSVRAHASAPHPPTRTRRLRDRAPLVIAFFAPRLRRCSGTWRKASAANARPAIGLESRIENCG